VPDPTPPDFALSWLSPESVKSWLRINGQDTGDDDLIHAVCAMAEIYAERCRPEFVTADTPPGYTPDAECYQGAVMYAAREYRRRNSPAGVETFGDTASFVTRYDSDIDRALQTGAFAPPTIA
jgi:hypothetical protein